MLQKKDKKICKKVGQGALKTKKHPLKRFRQKKFCRGYVKKYLPGFPGTADLYSFWYKGHSGRILPDLWRLC